MRKELRKIVSFLVYVFAINLLLPANIVFASEKSGVKDISNQYENGYLVYPKFMTKDILALHNGGEENYLLVDGELLNTGKYRRFSQVTKNRFIVNYKDVIDISTGEVQKKTEIETKIEKFFEEKYKEIGEVWVVLYSMKSLDDTLRFKYTLDFIDNWENPREEGIIDENNNIIKLEDKRYDVATFGEGLIWAGDRIYSEDGNIIHKFKDSNYIIGVKNRTAYYRDGIYINVVTVDKNNKVSEERIKIPTNDGWIREDTVSIDENGDIWTLHNGEVKKYENNKFVTKYKTDKFMRGLSVYDDENLIITSSCWDDIQEEKFTIVRNGKAIKPYEWKKVNNKYYLYDINGNKQTGWREINGKHYYMDKSGVMQTNKWVGSYYVGSNGAMATNKWVGDYYVDGSGKYVKNKWVGSYYCGSNGKYVKNKWVGDYYVDGTGKYVKNKWVGSYYCGSNGKYVKSKWVGDYYVDGRGKYVKNKWVANYYTGSNGKYIKNKWVKTNNKWYYCEGSGKYLRNTSRKIGNKIYKFNSSGVCLNP